jgi:hypothetical protein
MFAARIAASVLRARHFRKGAASTQWRMRDMFAARHRNSLFSIGSRGLA